MATIVFSEFEQDAIQELFNLGIGRAADALSQMIQDEVLLSVPHIEILSRDEAVRIIQERSASEVAAIRQNFHGSFSGTALLIYPEAKSLELVRSLLGDDTPLETLTELEQESLTEVGNVILNACLGTFANMLSSELRFELPEYLKGPCADLLVPVHYIPQQDPPVMHRVVFLIVDFITGAHTDQKHTIKGFVILLMDMSAMAELKQELRKMEG